MTKKIALAAAATTVSIVLLPSPALAATAPSALGDLAALHAAVDELVPEAGIATSLDAKVDAATSSVLADRPTTALNQLDAFGNELTAADRAGKLSPTTTSVLKAWSDVTKQAINNLRA